MTPTPAKILVNVFPKNGTHLLLSLLDALPGYRYAGVDIDIADEARTLAVIRQMRAGEVVKAHLPWRDSIAEEIAARQIRVLSIIRDPRDNVVSLVNYLMKQQQHPLHPAYAQLADFDERLYRTITGFSFAGQRVCRDLGARLGDWEGWYQLGAPQLHFEQLIGPRGGGDAASQQQAIGAVVEYLGLTLESTAMANLSQQVYNPKTHSFHKGQCGAWRQHFTSRHRKAMQESANWALLKYGYERDPNWADGGDPA